MKKRDYFIDCLRGYACLAVVVYHVVMGIRLAGIGATMPAAEIWFEKFLNSFHVPLFMFLSGYVFSITGDWKSKGSRINFIKHKFLNLGLPYLFFSIVYIIINVITPGTNHNSDITDIFKIWYKPVAQYWFLYALLLLFCLWILISNFVDNKYIIFSIVVIINLTTIIMHLNISFWIYAQSCVLAFGVGAIIPKLGLDELNIPLKLLIIAVHIVTVTIVWYMDVDSIYYVAEIRRVVGISASIAFISLIWKNKIINKILLKINKYSFPIYLLHTIFTSAIRIVLNKVGIHIFGIHVLIGICFGLILPIIIADISNRIPYIDFFFFPSKNIKRIRDSKKIKRG